MSKIGTSKSAISILEVVVAYLSEEMNMSRKKATTLAVSTVTIFGILCTLSYGELTEIKVFKLNFFDLFDFSASNILLPLGGFFIVIFIGWFFDKKKVINEITNKGTIKVRYLPYFRFLVRYLAPIAIAIVFLNGLGFVKF